MEKGPFVLDKSVVHNALDVLDEIVSHRAVRRQRVMEAQTTIKPRWTASRLFWISFAGFSVSLVCVILAVLLWWPLAFDWDSDKLPLLAFFDIGFGIISLLGVIASVITMIASGIMAYRKPAT